MTEKTGWLLVAPTKQPQRATIPENDATMPATIGQPGSLKALACLVSSRNHASNHSATMPKKPSNFDAEKTPEKLLEVAAQNGVADTLTEEGLLLVARSPLRTCESIQAPVTVHALAADIASQTGTTAEFCLAMLDEGDIRAIATGTDPRRAEAWRCAVGLAVQRRRRAATASTSQTGNGSLH